MSVSNSRTRWLPSLLVLALAVTTSCKKTPPTETTNTPSTPPTVDSAAPIAANAADTGAPAAPAGPRAEVPGEHCGLTAVLTAPSAIPGQTTVEVKLTATDGFHINELDEVQLQLEGTNATVRAELARTDATESSQDAIKFVVPAQVTAASPAIRGRLRFSVCASICVRQRLAFAVALP